MTDLNLIDVVQKLSPLRLTLTGDTDAPTGLTVSRGEHTVHLGEGGPEGAHRLEPGMPYVAEGISIQPHPTGDGKWGHLIEADGRRIAHNLPDAEADTHLPGDRKTGDVLVSRRGSVSRKPARKGLLATIEESGGDLPLDLTTLLPSVEKADLPRAAYAYTPEDDPATWKLPLWDDSSGPSAAAVGRAVAAIGKGFRGQRVQIPAADLAAVKAKIRAAWKKTHDSSEEPPAVLKASTLERIRDKLKKDNPDPADVNTGADLTEPHTHVHDHGDDPHSHAHRHVTGEMDDHSSHPPMTLKSLHAFTKSSDERRFTLGPQYVPDREDAHGEFATASDLQDAIHEYVKSGDRRIFKQHGREVIGEWVEMMSWPHEVSVDLTVPGRVAKSTVTLPAGTVFMGVEWTEKAWPDVKSGKISGYSMGGFAHRIDVEMA